jgi:glycosyltransferase involved in cell wall biosynthesis
MKGRHWTERLARRVTPDLAICNSHFTRRTLDALYTGIPSEVLYAPVETPRPVDDDVRAEVRASLDTPADSVVIAQACRSEEWKGHEQLLEALVALRAVPGWVWWQIGGAQRPHERAFLLRLRDRAAREGVEDRIRWLGERSDVARLLAAADVYCQPNLEPEPFGIAFIEALGAGLPVVTTRQGAAEEIVDSRCGALVPPRQPGALAASLGALVADPSLRRQRAAAARARAQRLCDPATQCQRLSTTLMRMGAVPVPA